MKKLIVASFVGLAIAGAAQASEWKPVDSTNDTVWFLDTSSLISVSGSRIGWVKVVQREGSLGLNGTKTSMNKYAAHCKTRQLQVLSWTDYQANGKVINSASKPTESSEVVPESIGETLFDAMCNQQSPARKRSVVKDTGEYTDTYFKLRDNKNNLQESQ